VKPWEVLGEASTPDGTSIALTKRDREFVILAGGKSLMSSLMHGSEEALAALACSRLRNAVEPSVLIGGLGMGFTLRATLDLLPAGATVLVAELVPAVLEWNRGPLGPLAEHPLKDRRVRVVISNVADVLKSSRDTFDVVLLDVDNGPAPITSPANVDLYGDSGIASVRKALKDDGVLAVWSARDDRKFVQRLRYGRFDVEVEHVRGRLKKGGPHHTIFVARKNRSRTGGSRPG
jgi:spermidine synthase